MTEEPNKPRSRKMYVLWATALTLLLAVGACWWFQRRSGTLLTPIAFSGNSAELKSTVIVPTLDTPLVAGKNIIWCASFQIAWSRLGKEVIKEPVRIAGAEKLCARLNSALVLQLPEGCCYAAAGRGKAAADRIRTAMAERFPSVPAPDFADPSDREIMAYAYLAANVKFDIPFFENDVPLLFRDRTPVSSFGIRHQDDYAYGDLRRQVAILYATEDWHGAPRNDTEFVLDLCRSSTPCQVVLARVRPEKTLQETLARVQKKIALQKNTQARDWLNPVDVLLAPNIRFEIAHCFAELEGQDKRLLNKGFAGYWMSAARQVISFRLDRSGAELASQSKIKVMPVARHFVFDQPFLVYMKQRDSAQPFFVMWVEQPELLCKATGPARP